MSGVDYMTKIEVTKEGFLKMESEYDYLITVKRPEIVERLKIARGFGDLSENAEYDQAKTDQAELETKIAILSEKISRAIVIDKSTLDPEVINISSKIKVLDELKRIVTYHIVGDGESDLDNFKISKNCPVVKALLGKKKGNEVLVNTPMGLLKYKILELTI